MPAREPDWILKPYEADDLTGWFDPDISRMIDGRPGGQKRLKADDRALIGAVLNVGYVGEMAPAATSYRRARRTSTAHGRVRDKSAISDNFSDLGRHFWAWLSSPPSRLEQTIYDAGKALLRALISPPMRVAV